MGTSRKDISPWEKQKLLKVSFAFNDQLRACAGLVASRNLIFMSSGLHSFLKLAWMNKFRRKDKQIAFDCLSQRFSVWFIWSLGSQISLLQPAVVVVHAVQGPFTKIRWNSVDSYRQFWELWPYTIITTMNTYYISMMGQLKAVVFRGTKATFSNIFSVSLVNMVLIKFNPSLDCLH